MDSVTGHSKWQDRFAHSGLLVGAILLHLILFLLVATWVVFEAPAQPPSVSFTAVPTKPAPPPPPAPPAASGGESMNNLEPTVQEVPPPMAPSIVTVASPSSFSVSAVKVAIPNLPASSAPPEGSGLSGQDTAGLSTGAGSSPFGSESSSNAAQFQGFLYDLKQTKDRKPTGMDHGQYHAALTKFVAANWSAALLDQYYKSPTALSTSSIFIPTLNAQDGPKAFHADKEVQPNMYVIWYKTKAAPAQDGTYHFVGVADDILLVHVDGKTVLDGSLFPVDNQIQSQQKSYPLTNFRASCPPDNALRVGIPFHARAGEAVDIDVLIGEEPGGYSNYFLYLQREESAYQNQPNGTPLLPIFQLDSNPVHPDGKPTTYPAYSKDMEPWGAGK
jgi:hypothetical protein